MSGHQENIYLQVIEISFGQSGIFGHTGVTIL